MYKCNTIEARLGAGLATVLGVATAGADITGFHGLTGWTHNEGDTGLYDPPAPDADTVHITTGFAAPDGQFRSIFYNTPQNITHFTAAFTYRASNIDPCLFNQGIAFVVQNNADGVNALGSGQGYTGITKSAAWTLWSYTPRNETSNAYLTNGSGGSGLLTGDASVFYLRDLNVQLVYDGSVLAVTIDDPAIAGVEYAHQFPADLPFWVGGATAYVGFTAATGDAFGNGGANQYLSNFSFVPAPSVVALVGFGGLMRTRRRS